MENTLQIGLWKCLKKLCIENITFGQYVFFSVDAKIHVDGISSFKFSVEDKILKEKLQNEEITDLHIQEKGDYLTGKNRNNHTLSFQNEKDSDIVDEDRNKNTTTESISLEQIHAETLAPVFFNLALVEASTQTDMVLQDVSLQTEFADQITAVQKSRRKSTSTKRKKKVLTGNSH